MEAKKVFVSVPMSGKNEKELWDEIFETVSPYVEQHKGEEIFFIDNRDVTIDNISDMPCKPGREKLLFMSIALQRMAMCDDVIFHKDWETAKGCRIEKLVYDLYFKE